MIGIERYILRKFIVYQMMNKSNKNFLSSIIYSRIPILRIKKKKKREKKVKKKKSKARAQPYFNPPLKTPGFLNKQWYSHKPPATCSYPSRNIKRYVFIHPSQSLRPQSHRAPSRQQSKENSPKITVLFAPKKKKKEKKIHLNRHRLVQTDRVRQTLEHSQKYIHKSNRTTIRRRGWGKRRM